MRCSLFCIHFFLQSKYIFIQMIRIYWMWVQTLVCNTLMVKYSTIYPTKMSYNCVLCVRCFIFSSQSQMNSCILKRNKVLTTMHFSPALYEWSHWLFCPNSHFTLQVFSCFQCHICFYWKLRTTNCAVSALGLSPKSLCCSYCF